MNYHNYFISLEDKLKELSKYVQIDKDNFSVFSVELAHLLMASCSEFEVVCKDLCRQIIPNTNVANMLNISQSLANQLPTMMEEEITLNVYGISLTPLENWKIGQRLTWWEAYNSVKHNRGVHFKQANLENVLNALAAVHIANFYLVWESEFKGKHPTWATHALEPNPSLLRLKYPYFVREW
ncbi:MAG: hypothetical protein JNM21_12475 [Taibaiella sp.]|nr:hypothetical protein [Taibaiella sp.]